MGYPTVKELHSLSEAIIEAGLRSFIVRRVLDRLEAGELSVREATEVLERQNSRTAALRSHSGRSIW